MHDWKVGDDLEANGEQMHENMNLESLHLQQTKISHIYICITMNIHISWKLIEKSSKVYNRIVSCDSYLVKQ